MVLGVASSENHPPQEGSASSAYLLLHRIPGVETAVPIIRVGGNMGIRKCFLVAATIELPVEAMQKDVGRLDDIWWCEVGVCGWFAQADVTPTFSNGMGSGSPM